MRYAIFCRKVRTSSPVILTFPNRDRTDGVSFPTSSIANSEAELKVAALESQLNEMKAMIAMILENQNKTLMDNKTILANTNQNSIVVSKPPSGPPPPPPPPPPLPLTPLTSNTQLKLKTGKNGSNNLQPVNENVKPKQAFAPSMTDVLKDMSGVKLRPIPR